ncbi:MAG: AbrB/MazE/SpoVT family DNA-binding domain-containing protein [Terracidiphilus sp.]|jgi:antitoxin VapB
MSATTAKSKPQTARPVTPAPKTAKLFKNGRSQAVRLPKEFRFEGKEVAIRRDPTTGEVILAPAPAEPALSFDEWFALYDAIPDDASEEEFAKLPRQPQNLTWDQLFKIVDRAHVPADFMAHRRSLTPQPSWEECFSVWDGLGSPDEDVLERDDTPPVERDFS